MDVIKTTNLTKSYGKARGIIDLNLTVGEGEFFGFIGPNGAGKSTTIRTLLGLIQPSGGSAALFGKEVTKYKQETRINIGYLPSEAVFYNGMKVRDIIRLSADLRKLDCSEEAGRLCERLTLDSSRKVEELSFGNRKKVGIVCALQHNPKLLILDEPTSGLDPLMQKEFFHILQERNKAGATIFLSSHILSEIQHNCQRAAIIREGRLIACDRVEALSKTNTRRVTVHGSFDATQLSGVRDIQVSGYHIGNAAVPSETAQGNPAAVQSISFLYSGEMNELIRKLSAVSIQDLSIAEPDLEEIFMHYYTTAQPEGGKENDNN